MIIQEVKVTKNPYKLWERYHIKDYDDLKQMIELFEQDQPKTGGFDTETNGLHIIHSKPFLIQFGWLKPKTDYGRVFTFYPTLQNMKIFFQLAEKLKYLLAHNAKFDLHMLTNIGYGLNVRKMKNVYDSKGIARLVLEAIPARDGGDRLELKKLGVKYVHPQAADSESLIDSELSKLELQRIKVLASALRQFPMDNEYTGTGRQKYWGKKAVEDFLKDIMNDITDLPEDVREVWLEWQKEYPKPTYEDVDRDIMIRYGADDIITMLEFFRNAYPVLQAREQFDVLERERKVLIPLYKQERVGLKVDRKYLEESRVRVRNYIIKLRTELYEIFGEVINVGQHEKLKKIFDKKWNIVLEKADKKAMKNIQANFDGEIKRAAQLIQKLRTLEKWYSTYIMRIIESSEKDGRAYTQIDPYGAVSGRMSSDFQQFPKDAILDEEGNELFHPRKAFVADEGKKIAYIDYSQVELRVQADYTIKVSGGDLNMTRAYMPFKCHRKENGNTIYYEFRDKEKRKDWGKYSWCLDESPETIWTPTDVHSETTHNALVLLGYDCVSKYEEYHYKGDKEPFFKKDIDKDEFKKIRSKGKTFNFMKNYGGGMRAAMDQLNLPNEVAQALIDGYEKAFPHVVIYQQMVEKAYKKKGYVSNTYGRRYYIRDANKAYKLANYLVQGSCADALKEAIIRLDDFIESNNLKSRMIIPIHDEQQFSIEPGEEWAIPHFVKIMEEVFDEWCLVPIVADVEITESSWKDKKEWDV